MTKLCRVFVVALWLGPGGPVLAAGEVAAPPAQAGGAECVVLLHGLARTSWSMTAMAEALEAEGYAVANVDYPSRDHPIEELAPMAVGEGLARCGEAPRVHFVTHSLGGILVRHYLANTPIPRLGRVVMLGPPNKGSEVVDRLRDWPGFYFWNGPAGLQLGTDSQSVPLRLGPVDYEVGVIAGGEGVNIVLSRMVALPNDGKVSVESTKVEGMSDFLVVPHSHTFLMRARRVIEQTIAFLRDGKFRPGTTIGD